MVKLLARLSQRDKSQKPYESPDTRARYPATYLSKHETPQSQSTSGVKLEHLDSSLHFSPSSPSSSSSARANSREPWDRSRSSAMADSRILPLPVRHGVTMNPDLTPIRYQTAFWAPTPPPPPPQFALHSPYLSSSPVICSGNSSIRSDEQTYNYKEGILKHQRSPSISPPPPHASSSSSAPRPSRNTERPAKRRNRQSTPEGFHPDATHEPKVKEVKASASRMSRLISPFRIKTETPESMALTGTPHRGASTKRTPGGDEIVSCDECGKELTKKYLPKHKKRHLSVEEKAAISFQCRFCKFTALEKYPLTIHERSHTKEKPCVCKECSASFGDPASLHRHRKTQHGRVITKPNSAS